ncbi:MAG: RDD family protein [Thermoanaerobaculia bacterium]|nr:RDD family protein [Thermoanaerobaculia bacterium]
MSHEKRPELPLFDLPLHDDSGGVNRQRGEAEEGAGHHQSDLFDAAEDDSLEGLGAQGAGSWEAPYGEVGVLDRLIGGVIDLTIHALVLGFVIAASWIMGAHLQLDDWPAFLLFLLLFSLLYAGVPLAFWGQTPGMMRVGHVARTGSGEPLTFGQTALRWLGALTTVLLAGLPLILALGSSRSLADRLSGSYTETA